MASGHCQITGHSLTTGHSLATGHTLSSGHSLVIGHSLENGHSLATGRNLAPGHSLAPGHNLTTGHLSGNWPCPSVLPLSFTLTDHHTIPGHSWQLVTPGNWSHPSGPKLDLGLSPREGFTLISPTVWEEIGPKIISLFSLLVGRIP